MRVLFVLSYFPALSQTFVLSQITGLLDRNVDVSILALKRGTDRESHADVARYGLLERTRYQEPDPGARFAALRNRLSPLVTYRRLSELGNDFDVLYCHFGYVGRALSSLKRLRLARGRLVTAFHGYDVTGYVQQHGPDVYRRLFAAGDLFLPISELWQRRLIGYGCPPERTRVHRMGVDCERFRFRPREVVAGARVRFLSVARLVEKKGIEYAIEAAAALRRAGVAEDAFRYEVVGSGPLLEPLRRQVVERGLEQNVMFHGPLPQERVLDLLYENDVFVQPSVTSRDGDMEGIPVALMEAMATGMPVLTTHHSGIPELVVDGESGLLAAERDSDGLARHMRRLLDERQVRARLGRAARARVEQDYDVARLNDGLLARFERLVATGRA